MISLASIGICLIPMLLLQLLLLRRQRDAISIPHETATALFSVAVLIILHATGITPRNGISRTINLSNANFIPFYGIQQMFAYHLRAALMHMAANLLLFLPLGFFIPLIWRRNGFLITLAYGVGFSLCIEFLQLFFHRGTDIDDILLNALGTMAGYGCFCLFQYFAPRWTERISKPQGGRRLPGAYMLLAGITVMLVGFM